MIGHRSAGATAAAGALLFLLCGAAEPAPTTWIVDDDGGPGVDFTDIPPAVLAAAPGDTILVRDGSYGPFVLGGKPLTIRGEGSDARVLGMVRVRNSAASTDIRLARLRILSDRKALVLQNDSGPVRVEECELRGGPGDDTVFPGSTFDGYLALSVKDCAGVRLLSCTVAGGAGADLFDEQFQTVPTNGGGGMSVATSELFAEDCGFFGGAGGGAFDTVCYPGGAGGHAVVVTDAYAYLESCSATGGDGGGADCDLFLGCCGDGGDGGDGLRLDAPGSLAQWAACTFTGGNGAPAGGAGGSDGHDGQPTNVLAGDTQLSTFWFRSCNGASGAPCPCDNWGVLNSEGCANSQGHGASLAVDGTPSVLLDDLQLLATGAPPNATGVFLQGGFSGWAPFHDGLLCLSDPTERLEYVTMGPGGEGASAGPIAAEGGVVPGRLAHYQLWYRDGMGPCGTGSNVSSSVGIAWR